MINIDKPSTIRSTREVSAVAVVAQTRTAKEIGAGLQSQILSAATLDPGTRQSMWNLFSQYYANVDRDVFEKDLSEKNHVIVIRERRGKAVQGFSTLQTFTKEVMGRRFGVIFSGDTIVARQYWGQTLLQKAFLRYIMQYKLSHPLMPVYWFLISKGYKTYLLMARNFLEYWPRYERPTPPWERAALHRLASDKFGDSWQSERGVVVFDKCPGKLRGEVAPIDEALRQRMPQVRFFEQINPGHAAGEELCCMGLVNAQLCAYYLQKLGRKKLGHLWGDAVGARR
jgi:hypothetical protein